MTMQGDEQMKSVCSLSHAFHYVSVSIYCLFFSANTGISSISLSPSYSSNEYITFGAGHHHPSKVSLQDSGWSSSHEDISSACGTECGDSANAGTH